jgi:hypothetical protein
MDPKYSKYFNDVSKNRSQRTDDDVDYLALAKAAN